MKSIRLIVIFGLLILIFVVAFIPRLHTIRLCICKNRSFIHTLHRISLLFGLCSLYLSYSLLTTSISSISPALILWLTSEKLCLYLICSFLMIAETICLLGCFSLIFPQCLLLICVHTKWSRVLHYQNSMISIPSYYFPLPVPFPNISKFSYTAWSSQLFYADSEL